MTFLDRLRNGLACIRQLSDTANRVHRMLKRGLWNSDDLTPREYIYRVGRAHRAITPNPATEDGSCSVLIIVGLEAFAKKNGDLLVDITERLQAAEVAMHEEAVRRYRKPRPGGLAQLVGRLRVAVTEEDPLRSTIRATEEWLRQSRPDPDFKWPDPGVECLLYFMKGFEVDHG